MLLAMATACGSGSGESAGGAGPASELVLTAQPASGTAGSALTALTAQAKDARGNLAAWPGAVNVSLLSAPAGATLSGLMTQAGVGGSVSFGGLSVQKSGSYVLRVTSGALQVDTASFAVTAATSSQLAFATAPTGAVVAGAAFGASVQVQDVYGNLTASTAPVTLALGPAGSLSGTKTVVASAGVATFTGLSVTTAGAGSRLAASSGAFPVAQSGLFDVVAGAPAQLAFLQQPTSAVAGAPLAPAVQVGAADAYGNHCLTDVSTTVTLTLAGPSATAGGVLVGTASQLDFAGTATFDGLSVQVAGVGDTLHATAPGLTGATSATFEVTAGSVSPSLSQVAAAPTTITAGGPGSLITVIALDQYGNPVPGVTVSLGGVGGPETTLTTPGLTNPSGQATAVLTSTLANRLLLGATIDGTVVSATASVDVIPGPASAAHSAALNGGNIVADGIATGSVSFTFRDAWSNGVSGRTVVYATTSSASLSVSTTTTSAAGSFVVQATSTVAETVHITATVDAATLDAQLVFVPGQPTSLVFSSTPTGGTAGASGTAPDSPLSGGSFTVAGLDWHGNPAALSAASPVVLTISSSPAGATLTGTTSVLPSGGVATFAGGSLYVDRAGTATLVASTGSTSSLAITGSSGTFTVVPGPAATLAAGGYTGTPVVGGAVSLSARVTDRYGNGVAGRTLGWSVSTSPAGTTAAMVGASTSVTGSDGTTTVSATLGSGAGFNQFSASSAGLIPSAVNLGVTAAPDAPASLTRDAATEGQTATAGGAPSKPLAAIVTDAYGNGVAGVTVDWSATATPGGTSGWTATSSSTGATGQATATPLLGRTIGTNTFTATVAGQPALTATFHATGTAGPAALLTVVGVTSGLTLPAGSSQGLAVRATDANVNAASGATVLWAVVAGGGGVTPTSSSTSADGTATATTTATLGSAPGLNTFSATLAGLPASQVLLTEQGVLADGLAKVTPDGLTVVAATTRQLQVRVTYLGQPLPGAVVSWGASSTSGTSGVAPATSVSGADGVASSTATFGTAIEAETFTASAGASLVIFDYAVQIVPALRIVPVTSDHFGLQPISSDSDLVFLVSNTAGIAATGISSAALAPPFGFVSAKPGAFGAYPGAGGTCGATLAGQASCTVVARFQPTADGMASASLGLSYTYAGTPGLAALKVFGIGGTAMTAPTTGSPYLLPAGCTAVQAALWGGGGGGIESTADVGTPTRGAGGGGGLATGVVRVLPGEDLVVMVGGGGGGGLRHSTGAGGLNGGGDGGLMGPPGGGGGGGYSALRRGGAPILLAAGGGGGGSQWMAGAEGGGGGGTIGAAGAAGDTGTAPAGGGTQTHGGAGGPASATDLCSPGGSGSSGAAGPGGATGTSAGGGGGGGYFGGGGGSGCSLSGGAGGGGGGSSFLSPSLVTATTVGAVGQVPPALARQGRPAMVGGGAIQGVAVGGGPGGSTVGGDGYVIVGCTVLTIAAPATLSIVPLVSAYYGAVPAGGSADLTFLVSNAGDTTATALQPSPGQLLSAPFSYAGGSYPGTGGSCSASLAAGASCTVVVTFRPTSPVDAADTIALGYVGVGAQLATLVISGAGASAFASPTAGATYTVPEAGCPALYARIWGGGGGGGTGFAKFGSFNGAPGGGSGAAFGRVPVTPGQVLTVQVGGGGGTASSGAAAGGLNGGGAGGDTGAGGGGYSALWLGASPVLVAGGGGGGGCSGSFDCSIDFTIDSRGGAGGGPAGEVGGPAAYGGAVPGGGTAVGGGAGAGGGDGGSAYTGGAGAPASGGGGGGGYFGGGGGSTYSGGGGGSGYASSVGLILAGAGALPGLAGGPSRPAGVGAGGTAGTAGGAGAVVLSCGP
jgi:hypothetical protein